MSDFTKEELIAALGMLNESRPGFEPGNYSDWRSYRRDVEQAGRDKRRADRALCQLALATSPVAADIIEAARYTRSGRVSFYRDKRGVCVADYCEGQYHCVEYRPAIAAVAKAALDEARMRERREAQAA